MMKILVATHKESQMPKENFYIPIHVGREGKEELGYIGDNTGDNISKKNSNYCELTGLYWFLKNGLDPSVKYVGLNHYRRYFLPDNNDFKSSSIVRVDFKTWEDINKKNTNFLLKIMEKNDVILPKKRVYPISIKAQYSTMHIKEHLDKMMQIIKEYYPEYEEQSKEYFNGNKSYLYNMFIIKKECFIEMMEWIFDVLFRLEKIITIPEDKQQARVFGFLSERLVNVYILTKKLKIKELPVAFISDNYGLEKNKYNFDQKVSNLIFKVGNKLWDYLLYDKNIKIKKSKSKK